MSTTTKTNSVGAGTTKTTTIALASGNLELPAGSPIAKELKKLLASTNTRKKAVIKRGTGKYAKQFRFLLLASNGKQLHQNDHYHRSATLKKMLQKNFPDFQIVDETKNRK